MGKAIGGHAREAPLTGHAGPAAAEAPFAVGGWLAKQRELRGIRLEELAAITRLPMRSLERLEAGAFDGQQDGFVRGFVRTVAVAIGLDPEDAVARLLAEPELRPGRRLPEPRRIAVAAVGVAGLVALSLALFELAREPAAPHAPDPGVPIVRRDAVRALAIEQGLIAAEPGASAGPPALLLPEPAPPGAEAMGGGSLPLGGGASLAPPPVEAPPAAPAAPD